MAVYFAPERGDGANRWRVWLRRLRPRGEKLFKLLHEHAGLCTEALRALVHLLGDLSDPERRVREIETIEKRADAVVDEFGAALRPAWLPPFPAPLMLALVNALDDIVDLAEDAAQSVHLYHLTHATPEAIRLAELAARSTEKLQQAVRDLARPERTRAVAALCREVDELEGQADHVMRSAMARLFRDEADARELVRLKAVYELLEGLTDRCKDTAHRVESLALKYGG
jgi:uncharacterized protein Yka (UPF0111/DUF47 family)